MSRIEKTVIAVLTVALAAAFTFFGLWEDKRLLCAPLLVLIYLALSGWALSRFKNRTTSRLAVPPGGIPLLLFWFYGLALIPFSVLPYEAKVSTLYLGAYLSIYWAVANLASRFSVRKAVWTSVFILLAFVALYSLVQHRTAPGFLFGVERYTDYWKGGRLGGTYQCPNHIAHLFQMWLPFCLLFLFIPRFGWFWRICFAYALPLFLLLIYQTQSRAGLLGAVAALGTAVLLMVLRKSRRAFCVALLAVPLLCAGLLGGLWAGSEMFRSRMQPVIQFAQIIASGKNIDEHVTDFRPQTWLDTLEMINIRPVTGAGPGNYGQVFEDYRHRCQAFRVETVHSHNEYLELTAEYGLVGAALVLWIAVSLVFRMIRFIKTAERPYHALPAAALLGALAGTAVHGFFDFELHIFPNAVMLALLAGCAAAPLLQTEPAERSKWAAGLQRLFLAAVLCATVWSLQVMSSSWICAQGDRLFDSQSFQRAETFYQTARRIDPQNWQAHLGLGRVYFHYRHFELDPARKHAWALKEQSACRNAYRINSKQDKVVYALGCAELFLGNRDEGLKYLRQVAVYKRFNDFYWRKLGIELRKAGLYDEALAVFETARKLDGTNKTVKRNIEWLKARTGAAGGAK
ncbi:MAG TPA: O-antigen ligase family protein [Pontiellaceae bacterium]|nr:O-antigen ligase family protein [Pontiellaceae bacterium]